MKKIVFFLLAFCLIQDSYGQFPSMGGGAAPKKTAPILTDDTPKGNSKISGFVVDSAATKAVEFASVALFNKATGKPVDGTSADEKGKFVLNRLAAGEYKLMVSFLGYQTLTMNDIKLEKGESLDLGVVKLAPLTKTLDEVTVTGQRALIEEKVDRIVYNAEKDIAAKGGDATDVLRKVPLLSVDLDGNVQLRGSSNIRVLINNKPSTIVASSVADALKQIPADMIKTVEVITSPSAKYDAEGSGGIINIVTKKNNLQGLTMNTDVGVGNRGANLMLGGNYKQGKLGLSLNGFGRANYNIIGKFNNEQNSLIAGENVRTTQNANTLNQGGFGSFNLGLDYEISKKESLTGSVRYGIRNQTNTQALVTGIVRGMNNFETKRNVDSKDLSGTVDVNLDYTKIYKPQKEWSVATQYSRNNRNNNFLAELINPDGTTLGRQENLNPSFNQEITVQTDYQTPTGKKSLFETGAKAIFRQVQSDFAYNFGAGATGNLLPDASRPPNQLNYDQNVFSGYASYQFVTKNKWNFKVGSRYEKTAITASFESNGLALNIPDYNNLVPSVNISKMIKGKTYKWAYNRRIQRPGIQQLNPNLNLANPQSISMGNPYLNPELTDNFEMSWSTNFKSTYLNFTTFYRYTGNSIESVRSNVTKIKEAFAGTDFGGILNTTLAGLNGDAVVSTSGNIGKQQAFGVNIFGTVSITPKWMIGTGSDAFYVRLSNNSPSAAVNATNSGININGRFFTNITMKNGWGMQGFGFMRGRQVQLQGEQGGFAFYSLGVKKDFKNKKGSISLSGENFLNFNGFKIRNNFKTPIFDQKTVVTLYNTGVRVNFSYRIGKMSFDQPQRKRGKSVNNDDVKDGEGGGGGQQQGGGGMPGGGRPRSK